MKTALKFLYIEKGISMKIKSIEEIENFLRPIAESLQIEIYEIAFKQGKSPALTVYITTEREGGIDLDTCEKFHRAIDEPLDTLDPTFGQPYTLNVSSAGLDRPFKKAQDFYQNLQKRVEVKLYAPRKGKKFFEAILLDYDEKVKNVTLQDGTEIFKINLSQIVKISQAIDFD